MEDILTPDQLGAVVLVDHRHIDDHAGLFRVTQRAQALLNVAASGADSCNHCSLGVSTQTLFKKPIHRPEELHQSTPESNATKQVTFKKDFDRKVTGNVTLEAPESPERMFCIIL